MKFWDDVESRSVKLTKYVDIFNGIQTSAERPEPIYWFSDAEISREDSSYVYLDRNGKTYKIEKTLLRPYFKPVKKEEKGLNTYSSLDTDKRIIFPYDKDGNLIPINTMKKIYSGVYDYLLDYYDRLVPKGISPNGKRDVENASADNWYKYGRSQALSAFAGSKKLIVGILSKEPMYVMDEDNMLISSGGTAGYCAISLKDSCPYELEYIQAWLTHPYTEKILGVIGSDFENGFTSRGTFVLKELPFVELDMSVPKLKSIHDDVVKMTKEIYSINDDLKTTLSKANASVKKKRKEFLKHKIELLITIVYEGRY